MSEGPQDLWIRARFKDQEVLAACDAAGRLVPGERGMVRIRYAPGGKDYRTYADRLSIVPGATPGAPVAEAPKERARSAPGAAARKGGTGRKLAAGDFEARRPSDLAVQLWTDGACSGNPGPAGLGVVYRHKDTVRELSEYLGTGTNNIAELTAILRGVELARALVDVAATPVDIMTDSSYCIGLLAQGWTAKKNQALVAELRASLAELADVRLLKVPGHAGVPDNERADELARQAIVRRG